MNEEVVETNKFDLSAIPDTLTVQPPKLVLYGPAAMGKSTFAAQAPNVIFANVEKGLKYINTKGIEINNYQDMLDLITALLTQEHDRQTLAVDTVDWLERLVFEQVCSEHHVKSIEDIGYGKGYMFALDLWEELLQGFDELHKAKGMAIILLGHSQVKKYEDPAGAGYDRYQLKLHNKAADLITEWSDALLFVNDKAIVTEEKEGFAKVKKAKASSRIMFTTSGNPAFIAKNRYGMTDEIAFTKNESWNNFISAYNDAMSAITAPSETSTRE